MRSPCGVRPSKPDALMLCLSVSVCLCPPSAATKCCMCVCVSIFVSCLSPRRFAACALAAAVVLKAAEGISATGEGKHLAAALMPLHSTETEALREAREEGDEEASLLEACAVGLKKHCQTAASLLGSSRSGGGLRSCLLRLSSTAKPLLAAPLDGLELRVCESVCRRGEEGGLGFASLRRSDSRG